MPVEAPGRVRGWAHRLGSAIDTADRTRALALLIGASALVWILQSIAWPVVAGRDLGTYLRYYAQMWDLQRSCRRRWSGDAVRRSSPGSRSRRGDGRWSS